MMAKGDSGCAKTANGASGNGNNGDQDGMIPPIVLASGSFNPTSSHTAGMQQNSFHPPPYGGQQQHYGQGTQGDSNFAAGNVFLNTNNASNNNNNNNKDNNYNYNSSSQQQQQQSGGGGGGGMVPPGGYPPQQYHPYHHQMHHHIPPPHVQQQQQQQQQQAPQNQMQHQTPQQQQLQQQQQQQLRLFWQQQMTEVETATDFKNHQLPLARIKKIMKTDEDVRMISSEAPVLFAKACEMFILELTLRSWIHSEENKRRTLQRNDIASAITRTDIFDFLVDIVPREDGSAGGNNAAAIAAAAAAAALGQEQQKQQGGGGGGNLATVMGGGGPSVQVKQEENGTGLGAGNGNTTDASYNTYPPQPTTVVASDATPASQPSQQDGIKKEGGGQTDAVVPLI